MKTTQLGLPLVTISDIDNHSARFRYTDSDLIHQVRELEHYARINDPAYLRFIDNSLTVFSQDSVMTAKFEMHRFYDLLKSRGPIPRINPSIMSRDWENCPARYALSQFEEHRQILIQDNTMLWDSVEISGTAFAPPERNLMYAFQACGYAFLARSINQQ